MKQSDNALLKSLELAQVELSARIHDRPKEQHLWVDTANNAVLAIGAVRERIQKLLAAEAESERKLSQAEYSNREVAQWQSVKDGIESRLELLVSEAARERLAVAKRAAGLFESVELERARLQEYRNKLDERQEALDQREQRLMVLVERVEEDAKRSAAHRRHAEEYHDRLRILQSSLDEQRTQLEQRIAEAKKELGKQQKLTSEIDQNAQGYRDRLKDADKSKRKADELMLQQADALALLNARIAEYENKEYLVEKRERFVMQRWDETCRQVAHLRLPVELQGMPTP